MSVPVPEDGSELLRPAPAPTWRDRVDVVRAWLVERPASAVALAVGVVALAVAAVFVLRPPAVSSPPPELTLPRAGSGSGVGDGGGALDVPAPTTTVPEVVVHVAGAVVTPGLVHLAGGARVADAVDAAGGLRPDADLDRLNLAAPLLDGQRVWVPVVGQDPPPEAGVSPAGATPSGDGQAMPAEVDLNTATAAELESLPGIGPATAQAILDHRRRIGRFRSVDELLDVRGIGPAKLEQVRDRVRV